MTVAVGETSVGGRRRPGAMSEDGGRSAEICDDGLHDSDVVRAV
ncbi:hypothetical protein [Arthrobacter sp. MYb213]|nr:hypothetical protein [Arthrobacter sp. MYb213]